MITKTGLYLPEIIFCFCDAFSAGEFLASCFSTSCFPRFRFVFLTFESFEGEHEQLGVVFVGQGREGDGGEASAFQPVHRGRVDGHRLLRRDVRPVLQTMTTYLFFCNVVKYIYSGWIPDTRNSLIRKTRL